MRFKSHINETTNPSVKYTLDSMKEPFQKMQKMIKKGKGFDIDDKTAMYLLKTAFGEFGVKFEMGRKGGMRKYVSEGEFGGNYGSGYVWLVRMQPGFSKVFRRFAKEKDMKNFTNHNKNPLYRELVEILSHEILHADQFLNSKGAAFDASLQGKEGITSTYTGDIGEYLSNPIEIEPYAQQAAIDMIRKGESMIIWNFKSLFDPNSKIYKTFLKKFAFYVKKLDKEGDIVRLKGM